jgi:hypothetical protein
MCPAKDTHGTALTDTIPQDDGTVTCAFGSGACLYDVSANGHNNAHVAMPISLHRAMESWWTIKIAELALQPLQEQQQPVDVIIAFIGELTSKASFDCTLQIDLFLF